MIIKYIIRIYNFALKAFIFSFKWLFYIKVAIIICKLFTWLNITYGYLKVISGRHAAGVKAVIYKFGIIPTKHLLPFIISKAISLKIFPHYWVYLFYIYWVINLVQVILNPCYC